MKIVFFGTSDVGLPILESLRQEHEVVLVVTSPDAPVGRKQILTPSPIAQYASEHNLKIEKPEKVKNNPEILELLRAQNADIFIVVSYGKILPLELLDIPPLKTVNVHFSLLPKYRGAAPIQYALLSGETTTGTTIFVLDADVDHGPVLAEKEIAIEPNDTFATLAPKLSEISATLLLEILPKYQSGELQPQDQNHADATFTKLIKKEHGKVDWSKPAQEIYNMWRAYTPWPGIYTTWNDKQMKILECEVLSDEAYSSDESTDKSIVPCGEKTFLKLLTVQLEGKNPTNMQDFLRGYKDFSAEDLK